MNEEYIIENDFTITLVKGRWILDSRGNPTVEADVATAGGGVGTAAVPAGASKGVHEALELRDGGRKFQGKGVEKAVSNINEIISRKIIGMDSRNQETIDRTMLELDGTHNKSKLGANSILAVSLATAKAAADTYGMPLFQYLGGKLARILPTPLMNVINGGKHAGNELSIQEFMIVPVGADKFSDALTIACEVYYSLRDVLINNYGKSSVNVGDEGGFAPPMKESKEALKALEESIKRAGYTVGSDVALALDAAASSFFSDGYYSIDKRKLTREELMDYYIQLIDEYPIVSIEDPLHEDDFEGFSTITAKLKTKGIQVVGDDIFVTNVKRLAKGIKMNAGNALLLKVNQIGTLTEALEAAFMSHRSGWNVIVSHRSGETEDTTISHLAVALGCGQIKTGAPARGERTAKYNELLRIEEYLSGEALYLGLKALKKGY
ncbi:MAG: phosphopyruvate hydratase [Thermofilaceae archaeon]|nr:phosphopyruvate hydratase [Thermofilaceae archaeon]MCX8181095.1 phosphopyruvate hydratase [Thermofilaceae archaeon]MDW8004576.1 phosphopyruvate hydratase [Thermofilaceae archaeon]